MALERSRNAPGQCQLAAASVQNAAQSGFGAGNNKTSGLFEGYPVVGYNHLMTTSRATCVDGIVDYENLTNPSNQLCAIFDLATSNVSRSMIIILGFGSFGDQVTIARSSIQHMNPFIHNITQARDRRWPPFACKLAQCHAAFV